MRVLHVDAAREWRGGQTQLAYLVQGAGEHHVAAPAGSPLVVRLRERGVVVHEVPLRGPLVGSWPLANIIKRVQPAVVAAHTAHAHAVAVKAASGVPVVVHRRVDFALRQGARTRGKYAAADGFIAVSKAVARVLETGGVPRDRVRVVYDGVPAGRWGRNVEAAARVRRAWGIAPDTLLVGAVGALVPHKGHAHLVRAMALLAARRKDVAAVICGAGELERTLRAQIRRSGARVTLVGWHDDVPAVLSALDVFVHASVEEGMGQAVVEAMLAEVPIVASAAGGVPEVVEQGVDGLIVPVGDADALCEGVERALLRRREARLRCVHARQVALSRFSVEQMVNGTLAAYRHFAARSVGNG